MKLRIFVSMVAAVSTLALVQVAGCSSEESSTSSAGGASGAAGQAQGGTGGSGTGGQARGGSAGNGTGGQAQGGNAGTGTGGQAQGGNAGTGTGGQAQGGNAGTGTGGQAQGGSAGAGPDAGACTPEGQTHAVTPSAPPCCDGLNEIATDAPDDDGNCPTDPLVGAVMCANCGDGKCGPGENKCNCPGDCNCTKEGETRAISPSSPPCCNGLTAITTSKPNAQGECPAVPPLGAQVCTLCGNGKCGPGENKCNCPNDCK